MLISCITKLGHSKGHEIVSFKKEVHQFLKNFMEKLKNTTELTIFFTQIIIDAEVF
jgi:hypothetical protein